MLVGPSDHGMPEALHPMLISSNMVSGCLIENWPSDQRLVTLEILRVLEVRCGDALLAEWEASKYAGGQPLPALKAATAAVLSRIR